MSWEQISIDNDKKGFSYIHFTENKQEFCETILSFLHNLKQKHPEKFKKMNVDLNELENYCSGLISESEKTNDIHSAFTTEESTSEKSKKENTEDHAKETTEEHKKENTEDHTEETTENHKEETTEDHMGETTENHKEETTENHKEETNENHMGETTGDYMGQTTENHKEDTIKENKGVTTDEHKTEQKTMDAAHTEAHIDVHAEANTNVHTEAEVNVKVDIPNKVKTEKEAVTETTETTQKTPLEKIQEKSSSLLGIFNPKKILNPFSKKSSKSLEDYIQIKLSSKKIALSVFYNYLKQLGKQERSILQKEIETIIKEINAHLKKTSKPGESKKKIKEIESINIDSLINPEEIKNFYSKVKNEKSEKKTQHAGAKIDELISQYIPLHRDLQLKEQELKDAEERYNLSFVNEQGIKDTTTQNMKIKAQREVSVIKKQTDKILFEILNILKDLKTKKIKSIENDSISELKISNWSDLPRLTKGNKTEFGIKNMSLRYGKKTSVTLKLTFNKHHSITAEIYQNADLLKTTHIMIPKLIVLMDTTHTNPFMTPFFTRVKNKVEDYKEFIKKTLQNVNINYQLVNLRISAYTPDQRLYIQYLDRLKDTDRRMVYIGDFEFTGGQVAGTALGWTVGFTHNVGNLSQLGRVSESKYSEYLVSPIKKDGSIHLERGNPVFGQ